jgi:putative OPT family oligopeptide transporter
MKQQSAELLGACAAALAVAASVYLLGREFGFGSEDLPAPQATLMKTVIEGVLQANLPWGLVLTGAALSLAAMLLGVPALPFAVGVYLPVSAMTPLFLGGCLRSLVEYRARKNGEDVDARVDKGILLGSGLIAGEGLTGVGVAVYAGIVGAKPAGIPLPWGEPWDQVSAVVVFGLLAWFLVRMTRLSIREGGGSSPADA